MVLIKTIFFIRLPKMLYMVRVNANLDLKTFQIFDAGHMDEDLADLCQDELGITFVARDSEFYNEAWKNKKTGKSFIRVVLPYHEVLSTDNIDLLAYKHLYQHLDKLKWLDSGKMKQKLSNIIAKLESANPV